MKRRSLLLIVMLLLSVGLPALAQEDMVEPDLRIGALPVLNMLPLYVALDGGFFDEAGVTVEIVDFASGAAAQQAAIAGEIDGFQADVVSALKVNASGGDLRVVRHVGITNMPFLSIVVGNGSGIESIEELAGGQIGLSLNTIIQYMTDTLLASAGVNAADVEYVDMPVIWERIQRLNRGEILAATLPAPYGNLATQYGGHVLVDDANVAYVPEAVNLRAETLAEKGEAVRAFLAAYERAVDTINAWEGDNSAYEAFLEGNDRGGGQLLKSILASRIVPVPILSQARVPSEAEFTVVQDWALGAGLLTEAKPYAEVVDGQLLPEVVVVEVKQEAVQETEPEEEMREPDLRIMLPLSLDVLPLFVAEGAGYFEEAGVAVELVNAINMAQLRSAAVAGEFDGFEIAGAGGFLQLNAAGADLRVVREVEITNLPYFSVSAGPGSGIESVADLAGVPISFVEGDFYEYLLSEILLEMGLDAEQLEFTAYSLAEGNVRDQIARGEIKVIVANELITQAISWAGAYVVVDSMDVDYAGIHGLLGFRADVLAEKGAAVRAFLSAYDRAVAALNALEGDTQAFRGFAGSIALEQDAIATSIVFAGVRPVPMFAPPGVPSVEEYATVHDWALGVGLLEEAQAYEDVIDGSYLPEMMDEDMDDMSEEDEE